jgi:hypothetical protein
MSVITLTIVRFYYCNLGVVSADVCSAGVMAFGCKATRKAHGVLACRCPLGRESGRGRIDIHDLWISEAVCSTLLRPWSGAVRASHYSSFQS